MQVARDNGHTHPEAIADVPRTIHHLDTDQEWAERDLGSKAFATAAEAAHRLRGLANVLYGIGLSTNRRQEMAFLGDAATDIALALERVNKAIWNTWEARDAKSEAKAAPAKSRKKSRRRRALP